MQILKVTKLKGEEIYPSENIYFSLSKAQQTTVKEFPTTSKISVEIRNASGEKIDTKEFNLSQDELSFIINYTDTDNWARGKDYTMWCRYLDSETNENNVVADITMRVQ